MKRIIDRLRDMREDHDKSQTEIAAVLGISQQHYSVYERGEHELPLRHFIKLAEYYGVSADYLMGRCSYEEKNPLDTVYLTQDCSCGKLIQDTLSLSEHGRAAVVEYVELQKLREEKLQKSGQTSK